VTNLWYVPKFLGFITSYLVNLDLYGAPIDAAMVLSTKPSFLFMLALNIPCDTQVNQNSSH
jgi:hypothetical protein